VRDDFGQWNPEQQRPEVFHMLNGKIGMDENVRIFPISNWTEWDVWTYIQEENIQIPELYFAHYRDVFQRDGMWWPASEYVQLDEHETVTNRQVRFRTVGDMTCTAAVLSDATEMEDVMSEIWAAEISERGARIDDQRAEAAMEQRKLNGYF
ncbi:MAG: sulfate adenylyltransferase subunit CysD, partial [Bacteroidota bacterium]